MLNVTQMILIFLIVYLLMNFSCPSKKIENFDADCYLKAFPDVAQAGANPLTHYKNFGKNEIATGKRAKPNCNLSLTGTTPQSGTIDFNKLSNKDKAKYLCQHDAESPFLHDDLNSCINYLENIYNNSTLDNLKQTIMNENNGSMPKNCVSFCDDGSGYQPLTKHSKDVGYVLCNKSNKLMKQFDNYLELCQNSIAHNYQNKGATLDRLLQMS